MNAKGIIPAIPTPFDDNGNLNLPALEQLLSFLYKSGVHGIFAVGNAGEFYALNQEEKKAVLKTTIKMVGGKIPVFFGAGSATTKEAIELARMGETEGADALSVITPYLIKPSEDELFGYFRDICNSTKLPVFLYNNPSITGVAVNVRLIERLSHIENFIGVKDSSGDFAVTLEFIRIAKEGFVVLAGRDNLILSTLLHGGSGAISSIASACPEVALRIYHAFEQRDYKEARRQQMILAHLRQLFSLGTFPVVIKEALKIRGIDVGLPRSPIMPLPEAKYKELSDFLRGVLEERVGE
jgi:4-hydroxy-tetrahydrodipicolinate synthase